jgi:hypothetical protein
MSSADNKAKKSQGEAPAAASSSSSSAVVCVADDSGAVTTFKDTATLLEEYRSWTKTTLEIVKDIEPVKIRGVSFPIRVERWRATKQAKGRDPSFIVTCTVGNLKNCHGENVGKGEDFVLDPIQIGKNAADEHLGLPKSLIDGSELTHMLIGTDSRITMFCKQKEARGLKKHAVFYAVSVSPVFTLRKPSEGGSGAASSPFSQATGNFRQLSFGLGRAGAARHLPLGFMSGAGDADGNRGEDVDGRGAGGFTDQDDYCDFGIAQEGAASASDSMPETSDAMKKLVESVPPPTKGSGRFSQQAKKLYLDPAQSAASRRRLELENPEYAIDNVITPDLKLKGYESAILALNCEQILPVQVQEYSGQNAVDTMGLYKLCPEFETVITDEMLTDKSLPEMTLVARVEEDRHEIEAARVADQHCKVPVLTEVKYINKIAQIEGQPRISPWLYWSKSKKAHFPRFKFRATTTEWQPENSYYNAMKTQSLYTLTVFGDVYDDIISQIFSIANNDAWERLAELILGNTEIWYSVIVNEVDTARLKIKKMKIPTKSVVCVKITNAVADFAKALRESIGIPITAKKAAERLVQPLPTVEERRAAKVTELSMVTCLTENPTMFPEAVSVECDFYAISSSKVHRRIKDMGMKFSDLGPSVCSALFDPDWYKFEKPYVLESLSDEIMAKAQIPATRRNAQTGTVQIDGTDRIRMSTSQIAGDLTEVDTTVYVYAVRRESGASAKRAEKSLHIMWEGGNYDAAGLPIVGDDTKESEASSRVLAITDGTVNQPVMPPSSAPPTADAPQSQIQAPAVAPAPAAAAATTKPTDPPAATELAKPPRSPVLIQPGAAKASVANKGAEEPPIIRKRPHSPSPGSLGRRVSSKIASSTEKKQQREKEEA